MQLKISLINLKSFAILFSTSGAIIGFWCSIPLPVQNCAKHCAPKRFAAKTLYNKTLCSKTICSKTLCSKTHRCKRFKKRRNCIRADLVSLGKLLSLNIFLFLSLVSFHLILFWACVTSRLISFDLFLVSGNCNTSRLSDFKDLFSSNARQRFDAAKSLIWDRRSEYKISFQYYWSHVFDMRRSKYLCKFIVCPFFDIKAISSFECV